MPSFHQGITDQTVTHSTAVAVLADNTLAR